MMMDRVYESTHLSLEPPPTAISAVPPETTIELLWRLAARLYHDHRPRPCGCADLAGPDGAELLAPPTGHCPESRCAVCRQRWPCSGRRIAELGLFAARQ